MRVLAIPEPASSAITPTPEAASTSTAHPPLSTYTRSPSLKPPSRAVRRNWTSIRAGSVAITGEDVRACIGLYLIDRPIFPTDRVRVVGEPVAGVVAVSEDVAERAAQLVEVEYEELPAIFDPMEAAQRPEPAEGQPDAPLLHPELGEYEVANFIFPEPGTNISEHFKLRKGDVESAWPECAAVVEETFRLPQIQHVPIEPHVAAGYSSSGPYDIPNIKGDSYCVYTNLPIGSAMRGFGMPEIHWGIEQIMDRVVDEIAGMLSIPMDPAEFRRRNCVKTGDIILTGMEMPVIDLVACIDKVTEAIDWERRDDVPTSHKKRGKGIAIMWKAPAMPPNPGSSAIVRFNEDATVNVEIGAQELGQGAFTVAAQVVDLEVDTETGQVEVLKIASAYDVGKAINPDLVLTQIKGGAVHGMSSAFEALRFDERGRPLNANLVDYRILNAADAPREIHGDIVETPLEDGPWGARGVGEHVMVQTAPAIANAINDALGIRFNDLPLSAEKIYLRMSESANGRISE